MRRNPGFCLAIGLIATCTAFVVAQEPKPDQPSVHRPVSSAFAPAHLGSTDPVAVVDGTLDIELLTAGPLTGLVEFKDSLTRIELAALLHQSIAPDHLKQAIWTCARGAWPEFVESMNSRRVAWRDAIIGSSRSCAQAQFDGIVDDDRLAARHAGLVIRLQAERAALEERFLLQLATCAEEATFADPAAGEDSRRAGAIPLGILAPLHERARLRNAEVRVLRYSTRWSSLDLRSLCARCEFPLDDSFAIEEPLASFEGTRTALALSRFRASQQALARTGVKAQPYWRTVASRERQLRGETRRALHALCARITPTSEDRLFVAAAGGAYPEIAVALATLYQLHAPSSTDEAERAWRAERRAIVELVLGELDRFTEGESVGAATQDQTAEWAAVVQRSVARFEAAVPSQPAAAGIIPSFDKDPPLPSPTSEP